MIRRLAVKDVTAVQRAMHEITVFTVNTRLQHETRKTRHSFTWSDLSYDHG